MANFWTVLLIIATFTSSMSVNGLAFGSNKNRQDYLNAACQPGSGNTALCNRGAIISPGRPTAVATARPVGSVIAHRPSSNLPSSGDCPPNKIRCPQLTNCVADTFDCSILPFSYGCSPNEKRCPQPPYRCVSSDVDCNAFHSDTSCTISQENGANRLTTQVLKCGDGKQIGLRCITTEGTVPVLTILVVQCKGHNKVNSKRISSLDVVSGPGGDGGAGIYQCSLEGSWEPMYDSPQLSQLTASCSDAGCGRVPQPKENMPIYRRWAWIRALYKLDAIHCTATLVSPTAAVTAASCLTKEIDSNEPYMYAEDYALELPGPNVNTPRYVQPRKFFLHPNYNYNFGNLQNNVAVIFFKLNEQYILPTVCIAERHLTHTQNKEQLVFNLPMGEQKMCAPNVFNGQPHSCQPPKMSSAKAKLDPSCITTSTQFQSLCRDPWNIKPSQFCATHKDMELDGTSNGEPYLVEVGGRKETWVLMGVRTSIRKTHSCALNLSIYEHVADNTRWLKNCVFNEASCDLKNP